VNRRATSHLRRLLAAALIVFAADALTRPVNAQRGAAPPPQRQGREGALVDLTGYWVSVVTEDWRYRMLAAPKGDYAGVALTPEGRKVADSWDPVRDQASGNQCKAFGAAGLMRIPGRLHITWSDDNTLKVDASAGRQTRLLQFVSAIRPAEPKPQGRSVATWEREGPAGGGTLKVVTTDMQAGYLRLNGVPYSEKAVLTEYFDRYSGPNGQPWLTITSIVSDSVYLQLELVTSTDFKQEPDGTKWEPTSCETLLPRK
jgi:hypothetical protein